MNIQCYWDGNSGSVVYENKSKTYTSKMNIPNVSYDRITYSEDDEIGVKALEKKLYVLTSEEKEAIKKFAESEAQDQPLIPADIDRHNSDPAAHPDIRQELSELFEYADRVCYVGTHEAEVTTEGSITFTPSMTLADYGSNANSNGFVSPANETFRIDYRFNISNLTGQSGDNGSVTIDILKNDSTVLKTDTVKVTGDITVDVSIDSVVLAEGDTIKVRLTFSNLTGAKGYLVPFRNFLAISNSGSTTAYAIGKSYFNTLGNLMFYKGYELAIRPDDRGQPSAIAGTWASNLTE